MAAFKFSTPEQKQFWKENGYIKLTNVYTLKEINEISDAYNELFERKHRENLGGLESAWAGEEMFLIQVRAADDEPTEDVHKSSCQGLMLRGKNIYREATMATRFAH